MGRFLTRDTWGGNDNNPITINRWAYANANPTNLTDPSGYAAWEFRVHLQDADVPSKRDDTVQEWKDDLWSYGMPSNLLGREVNFIHWMQKSGRLRDDRKGSKWYDIVDQYDVASRFASKRLLDYLMSNCADADPTIFMNLEPGVLEWAVLIAGVDHFDELMEKMPVYQRHVISSPISYGANPTFWRAHNAALREGVRRADAAGLRSAEPAAEQAFINIMLYNVLEPGDQCANGEMTFCDFMITPALDFGSQVIYPQQYPATWGNRDILTGFFTTFVWSSWVLLGARLPSDIHMIKPIVETQ